MTVTQTERSTGDIGVEVEELQQKPSLLPYAVVLAAQQHYSERQSLTLRVAAAVLQWWAQLDRRRLDTSWLDVVRPGLRDVMEAGQRQAVDLTEPYFADLDAAWSQRVDVGPTRGVVDVEQFVGQTADQRDIDTLLDLSLIQTKTMLLAGASEDQALQSGLITAVRQAVTETQDAGREADGAAVVARPTYIGYYRMLNLPSCDRCVVLAGKWYRWSEGFDRHDNCDCEHVPAIAGRPGERKVDDDNYDPASFDPKEAIRSGKVTGFSKDEIDAILNSGADVGRIVNAKKSGLRTLAGGPKQRARRPSVAYIYSRADGDRDKAIRGMVDAGYILPTQA